jgi:DNA-binding beta-propeller fold protein YncE
MTDRRALAVVGATLTWLLTLAALASASTTLCSAGSGASQCDEPRNIAVDTAAKRLYVADSRNNRIDVFDTETDAFKEAFGWGVKNGAAEFQVCTTGCQSGIPGAGKGQFDKPWGIAVDPANGDLYVTEVENHRVQKFDPAAAPGSRFLLMLGGGVDKTASADICTAASGHVCGAGSNGFGEGEFSSRQLSGIYVGVGPSGTVYVVDSQLLNPEHFEFEGRLQRFDSSGASLPPQRMLFKRGVLGVAVDSTGDLWVVADTGIRKYDPEGTLPPLKEIQIADGSGSAAQAVTVDSADNVFVGASDGSAFRSSIVEYDSGGNPLRRFGYGSLSAGPVGLALYHSAAGDIYASEGAAPSNVLHLDFPKPGPLVYPAPCKANPLGNAKATLRAEVNPEGKATTYHFEVVTDAAFLQDGFGHATRLPAEASADPTLPADFELHELQAEAEVTPETKYHCRVVAENLDGTATGQEGTFTSLAPLEILATWASQVEDESATLSATVNPLGIPASAYFEYVEDATYQKDLAEAGPGHGFDHAARAPDIHAGEAPIDFGAGESPKAGSLHIPGLSASTTYHYRLVATDVKISPKEIAGPAKTLRTHSLGEGALPDGRGYELVSPARKGSAEIGIPGPGGGLFAEEKIVRTQAAATSGEAITFTSWTAFGDAKGAPGASQYLSKRTAAGWGTENISPFGFQTNPLEPSYRGFSPDLASAGFVADQALLTPDASAGFQNLYLRDNQTGALQALTVEAPQFTPVEDQTLGHFCTAYAGASADGKRAFFAADGAMAGAPAGVGFSLYEWSAPVGLRLVSVFPGEIPASPAPLTHFGADHGSCSMAQGILAHAVSADGSTVFWTYGGKFSGAEHPLFARIDGTDTIQLDAKAGGKGPAGGGRFWAASGDGSKAFFTAPGRLSADAGAEGQLYRYDTLARSLIDLTPGPIPPEIQGVIGASEDATYAYFVAKGALTGEEEGVAGQRAEKGANNLYLWHQGEGLRFIAALGDDDQPDWTPNVSVRTARLTSDGRHLAFRSTETEALVGYDNTISPGSGCKPGQTENTLEGNLHCREAFLYDGEADTLTCASCNPTGARPAGPTELPGWSNPFEGPRFLSEDGSRLWFESRDALSGADQNQKRDVYEFERSGAGTCTSRNPSFDPTSDGCIFLISGGQSEDESYLLDASADGRDVFFATRSALVGWDSDENYDIYDARAGGGFPAPVLPPSPCLGEACKAPSSGDPAAVAPATPSFQGPGNAVAKPLKPRKIKKHRHKSKKHKAKNGGGKASHERRVGR